MIDIHSHLLPGVDDGAADITASLALAKSYAVQGVKAVICTPHFDYKACQSHQALAEYFEKIHQATTALSDEIVRRNIPLQLISGVEIELSADLLPLLQQYGREFPLTLGDSSYILIELGTWQANSLPTLDHLLFNLQIAGYTPILAHPERTLVNATPNMIEILAKWVERERLLLQVNASSIVNKHNHTAEPDDRHRRRHAFASQLLDRRLVHFVASDAHHIIDRPPLMAPVHQYLAQHFGTGYANQLLFNNPALMLADQPIPLD